MLTIQARILKHARKYFKKNKIKLASALFLVYAEDKLDKEKLGLTENDFDVDDLEKALFADSDDIDLDEDEFSFEEDVIVDTITVSPGDDPVVLVPEGSEIDIPDTIQVVEVPEGIDVKIEVTINEEDAIAKDLIEPEDKAVSDDSVEIPESPEMSEEDEEEEDFIIEEDFIEV
ncbi:hypothetical protein KAU11_08505 [Candidatus Babeliales bacterium]|nr:hypothetical protein [Candidatus Babeliales bacterium]